MDEIKAEADTIRDAIKEEMLDRDIEELEADGDIVDVIKTVKAVNLGK